VGSALNQKTALVFSTSAVATTRKPALKIDSQLALFIQQQFIFISSQ